MSATFENVLYEVRGPLALITLNRPSKRNAISLGTLEELHQAVTLAEHDEAVRVLAFTGAGDKAFASGSDLAEVEHRDLKKALEPIVQGLAERLERLPKPTIAAVNGAAAGLGADLALCCDFVIGARDATFVMSYVLRGLIPDGGGMYFLPRRVGLARAKELIFSGRSIDADEALSINMIEGVSAPECLIEDAVTMAKSMTVGSPDAIALTKSIMNKSFESTAEEIFALGSQAQGICYTTDSHRKAVTAFLNREK